MHRRAFLFAGMAASALSVSAHAASGLEVIYIGGLDCLPCTQWKNTRKAEWLASPEIQRVTWIEVESPRLREAYQARYWPGSLKAVLDQIPRKGGTPRFLIVQDGRIVSNEFGVSNWSATMASLRKLLE